MPPPRKAVATRVSPVSRDQGFYKRRRGILEHLEAGRINLIDLAVHDYLNLKANLLIGSTSSIPPGICITSAAAIHAVCPGQISERAIQRSLEHLEKIRWIKRWNPRGKHGNYPVLVCRGSVHDLSGNEYRINGEETTDWKYPKWARVGELSASGEIADIFVSPDREVRGERREKKAKAAKTAPPADPRYQPFFDFAYKSFQAKHNGQPPTWSGKDYKQLQNLLRGKAIDALPFDELKRRWENYLRSTESFTVRQGFSLAHFCTKFDAFMSGPIGEKGKPDAKDAIARTIAASPLDENGRLKAKPAVVN
jgi:hypothetical protein